MTETQTRTAPPEERHEPNTSEVMFHLGPSRDVQPFRWVAGITTPEEAWQHHNQPGATEGLDTVTVELPTRMSANLIEYARKHIGPNATEG